MNEFVRDFGVTEVVKLEQNYRSQGNILDAANAIIAQNKARLGKNLWTDGGQGRAAARLRRRQRRRGGALHRGRGEDSCTARAWRSRTWRCSTAPTPSRASSSIRSSAPSIAYKVYGGLRFFERQEVKHALAYLRLAGNPDDDTAFSRVVNFPPRGIGARSIEQLQEAAERGMGSLMHVARSGIVTRAQRHGASRNSSRSIDGLQQVGRDAGAAGADRGDPRAQPPQGALRAPSATGRTASRT